MRILSALFDIALLPISVAKDFCTIGGMITNDDKSATRKRLEKIEDNLKP